MKLSHFVFFFGTALTLGACNDTLSEMKEKFKKATGVEIELLANDEDRCATEQIQKFMDEFDDLNSAERDLLHKRLSVYQSIRVLPTVVSLTIQGEVTDLVIGYDESYRDTVCHSRVSWSTSNCTSLSDDKNCSCEDIERTRFLESGRKSIANSLISTGTEPTTQIARDTKLTVGTQRVEDKSIKGTYRTYNRAVFTEVQRAGDPAFQQALKYGALENYTNNYHSPVCGKAASLKDL